MTALRPAMTTLATLVSAPSRSAKTLACNKSACAQYCLLSFDHAEVCASASVVRCCRCWKRFLISRILHTSIQRFFTSPSFFTSSSDLASCRTRYAPFLHNGSPMEATALCVSRPCQWCDLLACTFAHLRVQSPQNSVGQEYQRGCIGCCRGSRGGQTHVQSARARAGRT